MDLHLNTDLENAIHQLGYASVDEFAEKNIKREIREKVAEYQSLVDAFEKKYGMNYEAFCQQFHELAKWDMLEKEDDSMEWETYLEMIRIYSEKNK